MNAQTTADALGRVGRVVDGVRELGEQRCDALVEAKAFVGEGYHARVAIEEANAHPTFQARNGTTDARLRQPDAFSRANEASRFDDCGKKVETSEQLRFDRHRCENSILGMTKMRWKHGARAPMLSPQEAIPC